MRHPRGNAAQLSGGFYMGDSSKNSAKAVSTLVLCRYKPWKCRKAAVMERSQISSRREWFHVFFSLFTCFIYLCIMYLFIYLILTRGREGEREGEKHQCVVASSTPYWGPGPQPRHVPWLGIELATL